MEHLPIIGEFISSYGFPMVMCLLMFWYMNAEKDAHKEEMNTITQALNNNTAVLEVIRDKLDANG